MEDTPISWFVTKGGGPVVVEVVILSVVLAVVLSVVIDGIDISTRDEVDSDTFGSVRMSEEETNANDFMEETAKVLGTLVDRAEVVKENEAPADVVEAVAEI